MTIYKILRRKWHKVNVNKVGLSQFKYWGGCVYIIKVCDVIAYIGVTKCFSGRMNSHYDLRNIIYKKTKLQIVTVEYCNFGEMNNMVEKLLLMHFRPIMCCLPGDKKNWNYQNKYKELIKQAKLKNKI